MGDVRDVFESAAPGHLLENFKGMGDVAFDFDAFFRRQRPLENGELEALFARERRKPLAIVGDDFDLLQLVNRAPHFGRKHTGLVGIADHSPGHIDLFEQLLVRDAADLRVQLEIGAHELESHPDDVELPRKELLLFHQHGFFDGNLADVVQHGREADLAHLLDAELGLPKRPRTSTVDGLREPDGVLGHALGVAGGGRIARFDGGHAGIDETFEQALLLLEQHTVFDRKRGLARDDRKQALIALVELGLFIVAVRILVEQLHHADQIASRSHQGRREDVAGDIVKNRIHSVGHAFGFELLGIGHALAGSLRGRAADEA